MASQRSVHPTTLPHRTDHSWNELRDRRVDRHGPLKGAIWCADIDGVEYAVNGLVTARPQYRSTQDLAGLGIGDDLHEPERLTFFYSAANARHRPRADENGQPSPPRFRLAHAGASQRRIDEERVAWHAVTDLSSFTVEQIGGDDLEIVVSRMGESAAAVALAKREDTLDVGR